MLLRNPAHMSCLRDLPTLSNYKQAEPQRRRLHSAADGLHVLQRIIIQLSAKKYRYCLSSASRSRTRLPSFTGNSSLTQSRTIRYTHASLVRQPLRTTKNGCIKNSQNCRPGLGKDAMICAIAAPSHVPIVRAHVKLIESDAI